MGSDLDSQLILFLCWVYTEWYRHTSACEVACAAHEVGLSIWAFARSSQGVYGHFVQ